MLEFQQLKGTMYLQHESHEKVFTRKQPLSTSADPTNTICTFRQVDTLLRCVRVTKGGKERGK